MVIFNLFPTPVRTSIKPTINWSGIVYDQCKSDINHRGKVTKMLAVTMLFNFIFFTETEWHFFQLGLT